MPAATRALLVTLVPSAALAALSALMHVLAGVLVALAALPLPVRLALLVALACAYLHECRGGGAPGRARSVVAIGVDAHGVWRIARRDGSILRARLEDGACVHPLLVVASFIGDDGARARIVIVPDMASKNELRELRVRLRTSARLE